MIEPIAFIVHLYSGISELWLADVDGKHARPLMADNSWYDEPAWAPPQPVGSPGGPKLAFASNRLNRWMNIWVVDLNSGEERQLTFIDSWDSSPTWSPDGRQIAFVSNRSGNYDLWLVAADRSEIRQLTDHPASDYGPAWSPDGKLIAFTSRRSSHSDDIWVLDVESGEVQQITDGPGKEFSPAWATALPGRGKGGQRLAYVSAREDGYYDVWLTDRQGRNQQQLTTTKNFEQGLAWSPDGRQLLLAAVESNGSSALWTVDVQDGALRRVNLRGHFLAQPVNVPWPVALRFGRQRYLSSPAWGWS